MTTASIVQPSLWTMLTPRWRSALARLRQEQSGAGGRVLLLALVGFMFWAAVFGIAYRVLRYFRGVAEIGNLMAGKVLGVILLAFLSLLLLSNIITALSTFFLAKDLDLLIAAPIDRSRLGPVSTDCSCIMPPPRPRALVHGSWIQN